MEFIDESLKINEIDQIKAKFPDTFEEIPKILITAFAEMIFENGHIHCDPHPGNILVRRHPLDFNRP